MAMDEAGLEDSAILLMSLGEEEAAQVFKHLSPREVQSLGRTIARMTSVPRERLDGVLEKFTSVACQVGKLLVSVNVCELNVTQREQTIERYERQGTRCRASQGHHGAVNSGCDPLPVLVLELS